MPSTPLIISKSKTSYSLAPSYLSVQHLPLFTGLVITILKNLYFLSSRRTRSLWNNCLKLLESRKLLLRELKFQGQSTCSLHCRHENKNREYTFSYTLIPARFPRIEGASGNVSEHHTSRSSWLISRTESVSYWWCIILCIRLTCFIFIHHQL